MGTVWRPTATFRRLMPPERKNQRTLASMKSEPRTTHSYTAICAGSLWQRGFTMIELLVVISIAAILSAIAVPSLQNTLNDFRQKSALGMVASDLNQARNEAIKRNARIVVCARNTAGTDCATSTDWLGGWVVCTATVIASACDTPTATNPNPFIVRPAFNSALTLSVLGAASAAISSLQFNANSSQGTSNSNVTLAVGGSGLTTRTITIANTGNISKPKP